MPLSNDLISQFVKITKDTTEKKKDTTIYGEVVIKDDSTYVRFDGAAPDMLTPLAVDQYGRPISQVDVENEDRVVITLRNHQAIITANLSSPSASSGTVNKKVDDLSKQFVSTEYLEAQIVRVDGLLDVNKASIDELTAKHGNFETLMVAEFEAINAKIDKLDVTELSADMATIQTLIFGSAAGTTIQTSFSNAVIAQVGNAQIKSAMIDSVAADKITAGNIITNNVNVKSEDGKLLISDETIQISDDSRVRVQIGKDSSNDYSINIWDANGNLMFSKGGITDNAIKEAIIRNDMVSETANISATKLDIESLFEVINDDERTIKSSKIYFDEWNQTLTVVYKNICEEMQASRDSILSMGTELSVVQGQIESRIWMSDIQDVDEKLAEEFGIKYSAVTQRLDGLEVSVVDASKTASSYLNFSIDGLAIGDMTAATLGKNILIDSDSVDIRDGTKVLASYGEKLIELGKNSTEAIISLCGDKGHIEYDTVEDYLQVTGDYLRLNGKSAASLYSNYYNNAELGQRSAINVTPGSIQMYSQESRNIDPDTLVGVWTTSTLHFSPMQFDILTDNISEMSRYGSTYATVSGNITLDPYGRVHSKKTLIVSAEEKTSHNDGFSGWYIGSDGTAHATHATGGALIGFHYAGSDAYTSIIRETSSGVISINGFEYATNKILWSGSYYMSGSQTANLSEAVSEQANGIVLVFSRYSADTAQDYHFNTHFVPKAQVSKHHGCGHTFLLSSDGTFGLFAAKYLYIHDTSIVGNDVNETSGTGACGIKYTNGGYVLRYVVGV